jgi:ABC-type antimicrobial peptide transport system permease subunit
VLLADEPTGNLDSKTTTEILTLLQTLNRERGITIVMVTHDPEVAARADRVVTVRDGLIESDRRSGEQTRREPPIAPPPLEASRGPSLFAWFMAVRLALRALARNKLRGGLTVLGILIGVAAVVTMSALGAGAKQQMEAQLATLGTNLLIVLPGSTATGPVRSAQGTSIRLTEDDARAIRNEIYAVAAVAPVLQTSAQIIAEGRNASTRVTGTTPDYFIARAWNAASGALFTDNDVRNGARSCVIGQTVRHTLFDDDDPVGRSIRVGAMPCTVTAVLASKGQSGGGQDQDDTIIVPITTYRAQLGRQPGNAVNSITIAARDPQLIYRAQDGITELLRQRHRLAEGADDDFTVRNMQDLAQSFDAQRNTMTMLLLAVASISLLIGGIGVMNIMLVSVTERTREIGTRLAIGARSGDILSQFLVESVVLAAIGGLAGLGIGIGASFLLGRTTGWSLAIQPDSAALAVFVASAIGIIFGFFPARRAAHLDPIVALRHE